MKAIDPLAALTQGCVVLDAVMRLHGFDLAGFAVGDGSGGRSANCSYVKGDARLDLHFRYTLGLVTYDMANYCLAHDEYMRAVLGRQGGNRYPGFNDDPMDGFADLRHDLEHFCGAFLKGDAAQFARLAVKARERARMPGLRRLDAD